MMKRQNGSRHVYRIAEVAGMTGVPATAIRYYEDQGLLRRAERAPNGYRAYADRDVERLRFVSRARTLGLPVDDLRDLLRQWDDDECSDVAGQIARACRRPPRRRADEDRRADRP